MSYQSEDRYWTDYLRVALPVIGLLLMLALFWWWAQQFIGDDGDPNDVALATQTIIATVQAPTPTNTVPVVVQPTESSDETSTPDDGSGDDNGGSDETPTDGEQPQDCEFTEGQIVRVTEDNVRLRTDPIVDADNIIVESISQENDLRILANCHEEDGEGNEFWFIRDQNTSETGYVAGEFLVAVEE